ncbi:MAG: hypothetical protein IPF52_11080 [Saprospiraceae bacterium]|nr:hypothetical protein [Saprospiraceae bacterium]
MVKTLLIFFSFYLVLLTSCHKEENNIEKEGVKGTWIWVSSSGGIANVMITPETTGNKQKLVIGDKFYKKYENNSLVLLTDYTIGVFEEPPIGPEGMSYIEFSSGERKGIITNGSELHLIDQCYDCFCHLYKRQ